MEWRENLTNEGDRLPSERKLMATHGSPIIFTNNQRFSPLDYLFADCPSDFLLLIPDSD
jgi:hypothetical protein